MEFRELKKSKTKTERGNQNGNKNIYFFLAGILFYKENQSIVQDNTFKELLEGWPANVLGK